MASGAAVPDEVLAAAREADRAALAAEVSEIWPDMANGVVVFMAMDTQWTVGGMGQLVGLDYGRIEATARLLGVTLDPQAFHDIRTMESEVLRLCRR